MSYTLDDFDYHLPEELIAQKPATPRDHSRLLVYDRETGTIRDDYFYNIGDYLPVNTSLVVNNSKVEKCRLLFNEDKVEIFVTKAVNDRVVEAMVRPGKKFKPGKTVDLADGLTAKTLNIAEDGIRTIELSRSLDDEITEKYKHTPFPPYIERDESLADRYQTVYAKDEGSKAAPTAGLHFTPDLLEKLEKQGIEKKEVTLHVGLGTFAPVKADKIEDHIMHSEWFQISQKQADELNRSKSITAVGTTSVRVLESAQKIEGKFVAGSGETDIFITPGYSFKSVDHLITNFHLPKSTLLMLISAFIGMDETKRIYQHAIREKYRFYSFGDAMLLL
ncbi:tRNA preQ1(34) S-adenosylmethionine ribosyltransferase-isomerase QueA [Rhodohalobacter barkolensis]|uniref:S-adenosylmethionine:tRNA ribosyltransferase-isomerase n=1 Tax=Rhodohalobacter barkolensis TaxID=2053187 RepID=A0A2N0VEU1_9BACT|nr:tRNA preQ1(34) S-adenosylmethionine ribosyltransferase-isomerase QueA [Rhodohalobacter barkolensis]PKD42705.1 tRNA preQ1(34) S-adenosylmethionine ribosyltransferase-isomerase QueA [Rhodohalobacter barkolensis]